MAVVGLVGGGFVVNGVVLFVFVVLVWLGALVVLVVLFLGLQLLAVTSLP
jgi:hypothetical protein